MINTPYSTQVRVTLTDTVLAEHSVMGHAPGNDGTLHWQELHPLETRMSLETFSNKNSSY